MSRLILFQGCISAKRHEILVWSLAKVIEKFVREALGCECPAEVFKQIEVVINPVEFKVIDSCHLIKIGGVLLVLIVPIENLQAQQPGLQAILQRGIDYRNQRGFNRFRLVVVTQDISQAELSLRQQFQSFAENDEKIHLHVLTPKQLPPTIRR